MQTLGGTPVPVMRRPPETPLCYCLEDASTWEARPVQWEKTEAARGVR